VIDVVNNSAAVILWYEIPRGTGPHIRTPQHRFQRHDKTAAPRYRHQVLAIRKSGFLPKKLVGNPETRGIDEISRQQASRNSGGDALNQV